MKQDALLSMSTDEIDEYAKVIGVDTSKLKTKKAKADFIENKRSRKTTVKLLGKDFSVEIKRAHDMRILEKYRDTDTLADADITACMVDFLGEKQEKKLRDLCTDEDGTVDVDAYGYAFAQLAKADDLKNF